MPRYYAECESIYKERYSIDAPSLEKAREWLIASLTDPAVEGVTGEVVDYEFIRHIPETVVFPDSETPKLSPGAYWAKRNSPHSDSWEIVVLADDCDFEGDTEITQRKYRDFRPIPKPGK